jgi:hypothetical protein
VSSDEPVTFKLFDEVFHCRPAIQGKTLIDLVSQIDMNNMAESAVALINFFKRTLVPTSYTAFDELINSEDRIVTMDTLTTVMEWLVEHYAGGGDTATEPRPTEPSSDSSNGHEITGPVLMDGQYSPVPVSSN